MEIFLLVGGLVAFFLAYASLRSRVERLEETVRALTQRATAAAAGPSGAVAETAAAAVSPELMAYIKDRFARGATRTEVEAALVERGWPAAAVAAAFSTLSSASRQIASFAPPPTTPDALTQFFAWLREDWIMKLGALLLLIALGWFTTYAFMNNWVGPAGRIMIGYGIGALFLLLGAWRIRQYVHQGGVLLVVGSTAILMTTFAARVAYDMFTPTLALAIMFLAVAVVATFSVQHKRRSLALASLLLAAVAPLLTDAPAPTYVGLFSYLLVVVVGTVGVVAATGHRLLLLAALIVVFLYSLPVFGNPTHPEAPTLLLFAFAFAAIFFVLHTAGVVRTGSDAKADLLTAVGSGLFVMVWILAVAPQEWQSLLLSSWMLAFLMGSFLLFRATGIREVLYVYAAVGVGLLGAATAVELSGPALTIAFALEAAAIVIAAYAITRTAGVAQRAALLFAVPVLLSVESLSWDPSAGLWHQDFFVLLIMAIVLVGAGAFFLVGHGEEAEKTALRSLGGVLAIIGSFYIYVLVWEIAHAVLQDDTAVLLSLLLYTVVGLTAYIGGQACHVRAISLYGGTLIAFVVVRLLVVDIWDMGEAGRIITFGLIGLMLMGAALLHRRQRR